LDFHGSSFVMASPMYSNLRAMLRKDGCSSTERAGRRKPDVKLAALVQHGLDRDSPAVRLDETLRDVEPEPETALLEPCALGLVEAIEQLRQLVGSNPCALVFDGNHRPGAVGSNSNDDGSAVFRVLRSVLQKVRQDLIQPGGIDRYRWRARFD